MAFDLSGRAAVTAAVSERLSADAAWGLVNNICEICER